MDYITIYVNLLFFIKLVYLYYWTYTMYLEIRMKRDPKNVAIQTEYHDKLYIRERLEIMFKFLTAIFLIYVFYPQRDPPIELNSEMRLLLYILGYILIFSAKWSVILKNTVFQNYWPSR